MQVAHPSSIQWQRRAPRRQRGGAALEYILVSTFAAVVGMAALGFVGRMVQSQLANMAQRLGFEETPDLTDPFVNDWSP